MDAWQAKQQVSTATIFLTSKRTQMIQDASLLTAFSHKESLCADFKEIERRGSLVLLREMEL